MVPLKNGTFKHSAYSKARIFLLVGAGDVVVIPVGTSLIEV